MDKNLILAEHIVTEIIPLYLPFRTHESYTDESGNYAKLLTEKADSIVIAISKYLDSQEEK